MILPLKPRSREPNYFPFEPRILENALQNPKISPAMTVGQEKEGSWMASARRNRAARRGGGKGFGRLKDAGPALPFLGHDPLSL